MQDSKKDTDVYSGLLDSEGEGEGGRMALKHVYHHVRIESPVYFQCRIQHAWGWCMGMTQRDVMGREVGGREVVHVGECMYTRGGFMSMYGKTNTVL